VSSSKESVGRTEAAGASISPLGPLLSPETGHTSHTNPEGNKGEWSPAHQPDSAQATRAFYQKYKSAVQLGDAVAKKRLLALWHRSLLQSEKLQSWAVLKLDKKKKAAKTAQRGTFTPFLHWSWPNYG